MAMELSSIPSPPALVTTPVTRMAKTAIKLVARRSGLKHHAVVECAIAHWMASGCPQQEISMDDLRHHHANIGAAPSVASGRRDPGM